MKSAVVVVLLLIAVVSGEDAVKYAGTTTGGPMWNTPTFDSSTGACTASTGTGVSYVTFNATYTTAGIRQVAAMAEKNFKSGIRVYIYTATFTATTPCAGVFPELERVSSGGGPVIDDFIYFAAGTYHFVVTGTTGGLFAVNIFPSDATGQTTSDAGGNFWMKPTVDEDDGTCTTSSGRAPFALYTWTQTTTGYYDIYAFFYNGTSTSSWYTYVALYRGMASASGLSMDPCNATATGATVFLTDYTSGKNTYLPYVNLVAGTMYTVVFSGSDINQVGYYGVQVIPTRIRFQKGGSGVVTKYTQPDRSSDDGECDVSTSYTSASWDSTLFLTEQRAYLIDTANAPSPFSYFDTYAFLYRGSNLGSDTIAPAACPIYAPLVSYGDSGDVTPVFSIVDPGVNYTVVVSTYSGSDYSPTASSKYAYVLYLFTGLPIGSLPVSTTGTPTTGGATTGVATTGVATTGVATTATPSTTSKVSTATTTTNVPSTTTSAASTTKATCAVALFFIAAALF